MTDAFLDFAEKPTSAPRMTVEKATDIASTKGQVLDILAPKACDVDINEVPLCMSRIVRYGGTGLTPCDILTHSLLVASLVPSDLQPQAVLHDAHETYTGEIPTPAKQAIGKSQVSSIQGRLDVAIYGAFSVDLPDSRGAAWIKTADIEAMRIERHVHGIAPEQDWKVGGDPMTVTNQEADLYEELLSMSVDERIGLFRDIAAGNLTL